MECDMLLIEIPIELKSGKYYTVHSVLATFDLTQDYYIILADLVDKSKTILVNLQSISSDYWNQF